MYPSGHDWRGHLLLIHSSEQERRTAVTAWATRGLHLGEKVVYLEAPDVVPARALLGFLDAQRARLPGALLDAIQQLAHPCRDRRLPRAVAP